MKMQAILILIIVSSLFFTGIVSAGQDTGSIFIWGANDFGQRTNIPAGNDFIAVAAGRYHTVALRENGTLVAWGDNMYGQCNAPAGNEYTAIAAGGMNSMALRQNGSLVVWGDNSSGQCRVPAENDFKAIAVGGSEFCVALRNNGTIVAWGNNNYGQCSVPAGNNFTIISAGTDFAMALRQDGSIAAWGLNQFGQCSVPSEKDFSTVSAGWSSALALRTNGTVIGWGMNNANQCNPPPGNEYHQTATGDQFSCALWRNNSIVTWGVSWDDLNLFPLGDNYFSLSAGQAHAVVLHSPLWVNASVSGSHGSADPPSQTAEFISGVNVTFTPDPGYRIVSITDNGMEQEIENPYSISGIRGDHQVVVCFGAIPSEYTVNATVIGGYGTADPSNQTVGIHENATIKLNPDPGYSIGAIFDNGIPQQIQDPYIIYDVEDTHDIVVIFTTLLPGSLRAWGYNDQGSCDVPAGDNYTAIAAGWGSSLAIRNGTLLGWGDNQYGQHDVPAGDDYLALASGYFHNLALQQDGSIAAWGNNQYGQCNVPAGISYAAVSAGGWHSLAIATNGSIVAWGESMGEAPAGNDCAAIASGWYHNLALRQDGSLVAWGNNVAGQCNVPAGNDYVAVSGGGYHSLALRQNGSIVAWGDNQYGQCNVPAGNDYVAVSGGGYFSLALRQNGSIVAWGANESGECNAPAGTFSTLSGGYEHSLAIAPASGAPVASFSATPKSGMSPLQVQFNDTSTGTLPLSYQWNFGDGTPNGTVQNPVHTYTTESNWTFTAVLTVENSEGTHSTSCDIQVNVADTSNDYWSPWVTNTNTTSAIINWHGGSNESGVIDYATSSYYNQYQNFDNTKTFPENGSYQHVQLTGLEPNTSYIYRVMPSGNPAVFDNRTFQTMPVSGPFTFIVISDSQEGDNYTEWMRFKYVADAVAHETEVLFILHGGDYAGHDSQDLWNTYFQVADGMLAKSAIFTTIGNHEYHNDEGTYPPTNATQYHSSYTVPLNYSFDCSDVRFVILNSPDPNNTTSDDPHTSLALATSQADWLEDLLDNNLSGTFTIHHHPIWNTGRTTINPDLQPWETLYHTYNISANFAGHMHNYQRFSVNGIPYFIVGDGGGQCNGISDINPVWSRFKETRVLGYLKVAVDPTNNTATAQEIFVATVREDDDNETPNVLDPPIIADTITFPLKINDTPPEPSGTPITAPAVISSPGRYRLMNDLSNSTAETAVWIKSSDVFLEGDGHTLDGVLNLDTSGVLAGNEPGGLENITITNLTVSGWGFGMEIDGVTNSTLRNNRMTGNKEGIAIERSTGSTILNCTVVDNIPLEESGLFVGGTGINVGDSPGTCILDSTIDHNGWGDNLPSIGGNGILSSNNTGLLISGCGIDENVNTGIWNEDSKDVMVCGNEFRHNGGNGGIFMTALITDPILNATIEGNTISESEWGIWLEQDDYLVLNNTVNDCGVGILLSYGQNATLTRNVMAGNEVNLGVEGPDQENYRHQIDTSNTVDGHPVYYLVGQPGAVIDGSTDAGVVFGISCPDISIRNLTLQNNEYGVFLLGSDRAVITNVTATENSYGFYIQNSDGVRVETCTARANTLNGFMTQDSEGVRITGSDAVMNNGGTNGGTGIGLENCQDILLQNVNASGNNFAGIDLEDTDRASLVDVTADANEAVGMILEGDSIQVNDCHILDNQGPGIGMFNSTNLTIRNNFFSNEVNVDLSQGVVTGSSWNTTKTSGTNIVGGPYLGGNYWASPNGTGFSQTHPDRGDGFCNESYALNADNTDYLPLHAITPDYILQLSAGWNFISVPKRLASDADTVSEVLLRYVDTANNPLYLYDASGSEWMEMRDDDVLYPLDGIWIYSVNSTAIPLIFDKDPRHLPPTKSLYTRWNAIGFSDIQSLSAKSTLLSVENAWTIVYPFDAIVQRYDTSIINGGSGVHSDDREMKPGEGYWLYMTDAGTLPAIGV